MDEANRQAPDSEDEVWQPLLQQAYEIKASMIELGLLQSIQKAKKAGLSNAEIVEMLGGPDEVERRIGTKRAGELLGQEGEHGQNA